MDYIDDVFSNECLYSDEAAGGIISTIKDSFKVSFGSLTAKSMKVSAYMTKEDAIKKNIAANKDVILEVLKKKNKDFMKSSDKQKYKNMIEQKKEIIKSQFEGPIEINDITLDNIILITAVFPTIRKFKSTDNVKKHMWFLCGVFALVLNKKGDDASISTILFKKTKFFIDKSNRS